MLRTIEAGPPISPKDVESFERSLGVVLPDAYREFLALRNGGRPERDLFRVPGCEASPYARLHFFFGIGDPEESCDLAWNLDVFRERLPREMLPIATTEGADKICLNLASGSVVFWDGYQHRMYSVADSFTSFMDQLYRDERSPNRARFPASN